MKEVWKYSVETRGNFQHQLPHGSDILKCEMQRGHPFMWVLVEPDESRLVIRKFILVGTGHEIKDTILSHISTFQVQGGEDIFHLFEVS